MKIFFVSISLSFFVSNVYSAGNSLPSKITSIETRQSGYHSVYLNNAIPNEGCGLQDRAVLVESDASSKLLYATLLAAVVAGYDVIIRVSGCVSIDTGATIQYWAPKIIKIQPIFP
jgi:hypothetical protein